MMIFKKFKKVQSRFQKPTYLKNKKQGFQPKSSKLELYFEQIFLAPLGIEYSRQYKLSTKYYDFYIPSANLLIECDGDYYHGRTNVNLNKMQLRNKANDRKKDRIAERHQKRLLRIWEYDIRNNTAKVYNELQKHLS